MVDAIVYGRRIEAATRSVLMVCEEKRISYRLEELAPGADALQRLSPLARTPILAHDDQVLYEPYAIGAYLDAVFAGKSLRPKHPRQEALVHQWAGLVTGFLYDAVLRRWLQPRAGLLPLDEADVQRAQRCAGPVLERADAALRDSHFLAGDQLTLADLYLYPIMSYLAADADGIELLSRLAQLARWIETLDRRPSAELTRPFGGPFGRAEYHLPFEPLERAFLALKPPPREHGRVALLVARHQREVRDTPARVYLAPDSGMPGDAWSRGSPARPDAQLTVMRADIASLIANGQALTLFGDNLFVELDISSTNLPVGTRLRFGDALLSVTPEPHDGCIKFRGRFGQGALRLTADRRFRDQRLRGVHMRVIEPGHVELGSPIEVVTRAAAVTGDLS